MLTIGMEEKGGERVSRGEAWKDRDSSSLAVLYRGKAKERSK
jgi:hypothetical protein